MKFAFQLAIISH